MVAPVNWKANLTLLTEDEVQRIHQASLTILDQTGMALELPDHRYDHLEASGARVDRKRKRVFFPGEMVEKALEICPSTYTLGARNPENNLFLDGSHGYLALDGTGVKIQDLETGELRTSTFQDLAAAVRVADALPQISFLWPCLSAQDKPARVQPLYELLALFKNSGKHIQAMTAVNPVTAQGSVAMAAAVAGGRDALRACPIISNFQCSTSPLSYAKDALEAALIFGEAGVPVGFLNMQIGCATAPATLAGNVAMGNAEILAGITFLQQFYPGAPTFYGSCATLMELRTGAVTAGGPEDFILQAASAQLARHYRLPANIGTFATGAKRTGWHSGVENAVSGAVSQFTRADMMCGAGLTRAATVFSYEQLIMDCEIFDIIAQVARGIRVDTATLAVDVVDRVGPKNHFMLDTHTLEHMRSAWQPTVMDRSGYDQWAAKGRPATRDHAGRLAKEILATHEPPPLAQEDELLDIIRSIKMNTISTYNLAGGANDG